jgi:hypothetical protein
MTTPIKTRLLSCFVGVLLCAPIFFLIVAYLQPEFPGLAGVFWVVFALYVGLAVIVLHHAEVGRQHRRRG